MYIICAAILDVFVRGLFLEFILFTYTYIAWFSPAKTRRNTYICVHARTHTCACIHMANSKEIE